MNGTTDQALPFNNVRSFAERQGVGLRVRGLRKSYNGHEVLKDINFEVNAGEIFVIMGPSGSGKTVLLKQLIGLEKPDMGEVLVDGQAIQSPELTSRYRVAMVFQSGALPNGMPLTIIDRSGVSSTSQLRLPSLSLFPSPLARARAGMALPATSGPSALTAAIVLSNPRMWTVIEALAGLPWSKRMTPVKSASIAGATTCEGANSIRTGPALKRAASTLSAS